MQVVLKILPLVTPSLVVLEMTYGDECRRNVVYNYIKPGDLVAYEGCILYFCESRPMRYR